MNQINNPCPDNILGIDVSKYKLDFYLLSTGQSWCIPNTQKDILACIRKLKVNGPIKMVVMEHTGGYELLVKQLFIKRNIPVHMAHPNRIYHFSKQKGYYAKTDAIDAKIIAQYGCQESVTATLICSKEEQILKALYTRRLQLSEQLCAERHREQPFVLAVVKSSYARHIKQLSAEIKKITQEIDLCINKNPEKRHLL